VHPIAPEDGRARLAAVCHDAHPQVAVLDVDWPQAAGAAAGAPIPSLLRELVTAVAGRPRPAVLPPRLHGAPAGRRLEIARAFVRDEVTRVAGLDPVRPFDAHKPLRDLGLDSLMITELARALGAGAGIAVPAATVFSYPSVAELAAWLLARLVPEETGGNDTPPGDERHASLAEAVRQLSEAELEAFLLAEGGGTGGAGGPA
jgi:acyl carrier protein